MIHICLNQTLAKCSAIARTVNEKNRKGLSSAPGHIECNLALLTYCFLEVLTVESLLSTGLVVNLSVFLTTQSCGDLRILGVLFNHKCPV